jgi:hypothetical protein
VSSRPIIEALDKFKGNASSLSPCLKVLSINTFTFETVEETFYSHIIVTISRTAHAGYYVLLLQKSLILLTRVGASMIRMMKQASLGTATNDGHAQCLDNELGILDGRHGPSYHHPREHIKHHCKEEPADLGSKWRLYPQPIWCLVDQHESRAGAAWGLPALLARSAW